MYTIRLEGLQMLQVIVGLFSGTLPILFMLIFGGTAIFKAFGEEWAEAKLSGGLTVLLLLLFLLATKAQDSFDLEKCMSWHDSRPAVEECYRNEKSNRLY